VIGDRGATEGVLLDCGGMSGTLTFQTENDVPHLKSLLGVEVVELLDEMVFDVHGLIFGIRFDRNEFLTVGEGIHQELMGAP
jgi:hypothetical protein